MRGGGGRLLLAFVGGCLLASWAPSLPGMPALLVLAALAGTGCAFRYTRLPAAFLLGALWFLAAAQGQIGSQWPAEEAGATRTLTGTVVGLPQRHEQTVRFVLAVDEASTGTALPERIRVSWYRPFRRVVPGSRWRMTLRLEPPVGRDNPNGFDYERYLLARRIAATGSVRGRPELVADDPGERWLDRQRQRLSDIIQSETVDRDVAALKRALGVADRSAMPTALSERLRETGTAHLLAISGLHVGMVAGLAGLLSGWLAAPLSLVASRFDRRRVGVSFGLLAAVAYAGLAGFTLPTQRALVMLAVVAAALFFRRAVPPGRALLLALLAVLVFDPLSPLSLGFWLSFAAVAVLVFAFAWRPSRPGQWVAGLLRAQMVLLIGLLPLNVGLFGQLVPGAFLANLAAIPLVGLVVLPSLLVDIATMLLGWPASPLAAPADFGLRLLLDILEGLHGLGGTHIAMSSAATWAIPLAAAGAAWLIAPPGWPARGLGAVLLLPLLWPAADELGEDQLEAWFLDVGNGLAVLVRTADEALLYDTGPGDGEGSDAISGILPGVLRTVRLDGVDRVVISHEHRGHSGGLASVTGEGVAVQAATGRLGAPCVAGRSWRSAGWRFRFLHPSAALPDLGGNSSCVLHVSGPGGDLLLTGGIDADVEARLVAEWGGPASDVLQLPSGGHREGSSRGFLEAVSPGTAIASVARHDRFGRVHAETRERLQAHGTTLLTTGRCGAIRVRFASDRPPGIRSMATLAPRFWKPRTGCP
ncbi:DNA internalization-related competence protein ComEC/Rec2 [Wenzhouxiangella sediminis]|uniref:DNA internalization-related competence protein ComEC/Rec2 n=1 Tax=Wenzhouxiangella sediminis TaxID=1792836 RepID=A0A3E1KAN4_9GAMM|nr:DNA internalization-related competence protein ComEC/Rec2 [Wenzhouxiangella sediminis]RFF31500.1 DNA internalization-related competence protein ComEC/Rec2 [Wenzhouxiangella sediminis]